MVDIKYGRNSCYKYDNCDIGVRVNYNAGIGTVVVLSTDVTFKDTNGDGVYEIIY